MLRLTQSVTDAMLAHAVRGAPWEACGLIGGVGAADLATRFAPMRNAAQSSEIYQLEGAEMLEVESQFEAEGCDVLGVMHSHTRTDAYPSPTDVADAARFDPWGRMHFVIVSLRGDEPVLRDYKIRDGHIQEILVSVVSDG